MSVCVGNLSGAQVNDWKSLLKVKFAGTVCVKKVIMCTAEWCRGLGSVAVSAWGWRERLELRLCKWLSGKTKTGDLEDAIVN